MCSKSEWKRKNIAGGSELGVQLVLELNGKDRLHLRRKKENKTFF